MIELRFRERFLFTDRKHDSIVAVALVIASWLIYLMQDTTEFQDSRLLESLFSMRFVVGNSWYIGIVDMLTFS